MCVQMMLSFVAYLDATPLQVQEAEIWEAFLWSNFVIELPLHNVIQLHNSITFVIQLRNSINVISVYIIGTFSNRFGV